MLQEAVFADEILVTKTGIHPSFIALWELTKLTKAFERVAVP